MSLLLNLPSDILFYLITHFFDHPRDICHLLATTQKLYFHPSFSIYDFSYCIPSFLKIEKGKIKEREKTTFKNEHNTIFNKSNSLCSLVLQLALRNWTTKEQLILRLFEKSAPISLIHFFNQVYSIKFLLKCTNVYKKALFFATFQNSLKHIEWLLFRIHSEQLLILDKEKQKDYEKYILPTFWNEGLYGAAQGGHTHWIEYFINEKGAYNWNKALYYAAKGNQKEIISYLINEKGADDSNLGLEGAAEGGHLELIKFFHDEIFWINEEAGLRGATRGGHFDLVKGFISRGAGDYKLRLYDAAKNGHLELVRFFLDKIENHSWTILNSGLAYAAEGGHVDVIQFFIDKGANHFSYALYGTARGGHLEMVKIYIKNIVGSDLDWAMCGAVRGGHLNIVEFLIEQGCTDWIWGLEGAAHGGHVELVSFFIEKGANEFVQSMIYAIGGNYFELVRYFIEKKFVDISKNCVQMASDHKNILIKNYLEQQLLLQKNKK